MTIFDYVVLGIVGLSVLLAVWRGAVREVLALASWVVAFLLARTYGVTVAAILPASIPGESIKLIAGFVIVFLAALLLMALITIGISQLVRAVGLGLADRAVGALFGLARGTVIVMTLVLLAGLTPAPRDALWRNAMLSAPLEALAIELKPLLPGELSRRISYD